MSSPAPALALVRPAARASVPVPPVAPTLNALSVVPSLCPLPVPVVGHGDPAPSGAHVRVAAGRRPQVRRTAYGLAVDVSFGDAAFAAPLIAAFAAPAFRPAAAAPESLALLALAERVAGHDVSVLIEGPTGTGKEGLARLIHDQSPRRDFPLVAVNCAALPEAMLEATLFGHERGAFTGVMASSRGLFRAAQGGTLLLDEIAELPLPLQAKLLRVLQEREVLPIGATLPEKIDVRIVACANRDLAAEVEAGRFRADLFYRLAVFPLRTTSLAERPADIAAIAAAMLLRTTSGDAVPWLSGPALAALQAYDWPGNVRELANVLDRARVLADDDRIDLQHIVFDRLAGPATTVPLAGTVRHHEARIIRQAVATAPGRRAAADRLGISERTLRYKLAAMTGRGGSMAATVQ